MGEWFEHNPAWLLRIRPVSGDQYGDQYGQAFSRDLRSFRAGFGRAAFWSASVGTQKTGAVDRRRPYKPPTGSSAGSDWVALVVKHGGDLQMAAKRLHVGAQRR